MTDRHRIQNGLSATIKADGAELCSLQDAGGRDYLWDAGPLWPSHSPVLFPIVGQVAGDQLHIDGRSFPMSRHGFARRRRFEWGERHAESCTLLLRDDEASRAVFPFPFALAINYRIEKGGLGVVYELGNPGAAPLPASLGAHPAFRWPLGEDDQRDYRIEFAEDEPAAIHRVRAGLLDPGGKPTPIQGRRLDLDPDLFVDDAIIMLGPRSRSLRYLGPGGGLEFSWEGFPQLGLWQKPGARFLCIEPWHGYSSPEGWDGEFIEKPGLLVLPPGETRTFSWTVRPLDV